MGYNDRVKFSELRGLTLLSIEGAEQGSDRVIFKTRQGLNFIMYHSQDCCESVSLDEIHGDIQDLIGTPILLAEESTSEEHPPEEYTPESFTWTFYRLVTILGSVQLKWLGTSNGYYSERVDFERYIDG